MASSACFSSLRTSVAAASPRSEPRLWRSNSTGPLHTLAAFQSLSQYGASLSLSASRLSRRSSSAYGPSRMKARAELSEVQASSYGAVASDDDEEDSAAEGAYGDEASDSAGLPPLDYRSSEEETKLYVGNLPWTVTSEELAEVFQKVGSVEMVEVIYDRETGRSRGFGFVTMSTVEDANAAIQKFDGSDYSGRILRVNFPNRGRGDFSSSPPPRRFDNNENKLFVGNLSWSVDSDTLRDVFSQHGTVVEARVVNDRDTGRSRGFGFVTMSSEEETNEALNKLDGADVEGRNIRVNMAGERPSGRGSIF